MNQHTQESEPSIVTELIDVDTISLAELRRLDNSIVSRAVHLVTGQGTSRTETFCSSLTKF